MKKILHDIYQAELTQVAFQHVAPPTITHQYVQIHNGAGKKIETLLRKETFNLTRGGSTFICSDQLAFFFYAEWDSR